MSPVGSTVEKAWNAIVSGKSGIRPITEFDSKEFSSKITGSVSDFVPDAYLHPREQRKVSLFIVYGIGAAVDALNDSGLEMVKENPSRVGVMVGSGMGGLPEIEMAHKKYLDKGSKRISPFFVPSNIINMLAGNISIHIGAKGPSYSVVSACATGAHNIGDAARKIALGDADIMFAGGSEMVCCPMAVGGFCSARALSTAYNHEPERASRPWDKGRDGFVLSSGAGVLVLEEYDRAHRRGADIYCELLGYGHNCDAFHITQPSKNGAGAAECISNTLVDAELAPERIDYINAHGTSTPAGDLAETHAIKRAFGSHAHQLMVSSSKSMTGHLLGAAGGVEAAFSALSLRDQVVPPTINIDEPSEDCDLDYVPHTAREAKVNVVLSNSFGFGGSNVTLAFGRL